MSASTKNRSAGPAQPDKTAEAEQRAAYHAAHARDEHRWRMQSLAVRQRYAAELRSIVEALETIGRPNDTTDGRAQYSNGHHRSASALAVQARAQLEQLERMGFAS